MEKLLVLLPSQRLIEPLRARVAALRGERHAQGAGALGIAPGLLEQRSRDPVAAEGRRDEEVVQDPGAAGGHRPERGIELGEAGGGVGFPSQEDDRLTELQPLPQKPLGPGRVGSLAVKLAIAVEERSELR